MFSPCSILSQRYSVPLPQPAPKYGADSREVLQGVLGFSPAEVDAMLASGVVGEQWSDRYIPNGDPWANTPDEYAAFIRNVEQLGVRGSAGAGDHRTSKL